MTRYSEQNSNAGLGGMDRSPISLVADNHLEEGRVPVTGPKPTGPTELI